MPSPSPRRAERRDERSAAPGGASAAGVARPSLHATITKIMSESVKLKEAAARFNRLREQLPTAAADRALCAALLADIKAQIVEDLGEDLDEDLGEAAAACGHAQQSVLAQMMSQIADDLGEANAYGHAPQPDALRAARVPAQARPSQRRAVLAPISEESFGTSRCAGPHGGHKACDVSASECIERFDSGLRMDRMSSSTLSSTSTISAPSTPVVALQARSDPSASSSTRERTSERERLDDAYHPSSLRDNGANSAAAQAECEGAAARVLARVSGEDAKDGDRRDCKACGASGELGRQLCRASQPSCPTAPSAACSGPAAACAEPCRPRSVPSVRVSLHTALPRAPGEKGLAAIASIERPEAGSLPRLRFRQGFTTLASFALDGKSITLWLAADPAGPHSNVEQITHWRNVPQGAQWLKLSCVQGGDLYVFAARGWGALLSHFYA